MADGDGGSCRYRRIAGVLGIRVGHQLHALVEFDHNLTMVSIHHGSEIHCPSPIHLSQ